MAALGLRCNARCGSRRLVMAWLAALCAVALPLVCVNVAEAAGGCVYVEITAYAFGCNPPSVCDQDASSIKIRVDKYVACMTP